MEYVTLYSLSSALSTYPKGEGKKRITELTGPDNSIHGKGSMVEIVNSDKICMARAIGVCFANLCVIPETSGSS